MIEPIFPTSPPDSAASSSGAPGEPRHSAGTAFLRHLRWLAAIILSATVFIWVGAHTVASPNVDGTVALAWGPAVSLAAEAAMLGALILTFVLSSLIIWPDTPHAGLFTACIGLAALAVRWGGVHRLLVHHYSDMPAMFHALALQCLYWIIFVLLGEICCRFLYRRLGRSRHWPGLLGLPWPPPWESSGWQTPAYPSAAIALCGLKPAANNPIVSGLRRLADHIAGLLLTGLAAALVLAILLKSQDPGQVLFACFIAFAAGGFVAGMAVPLAADWSIWLAVPATALVGYWIAASGMAAFPGQVPLLHGSPVYLARGLPVYYVSAGWAGAMTGFYTALRVHYRHRFDQFFPMPEKDHCGWRNAN